MRTTISHTIRQCDVGETRQHTHDLHQITEHDAHGMRRQTIPLLVAVGYAEVDDLREVLEIDRELGRWRRRERQQQHQLAAHELPAGHERALVDHLLGALQLQLSLELFERHATMVLQQLVSLTVFASSTFELGICVVELLPLCARIESKVLEAASHAATSFEARRWCTYVAREPAVAHQQELKHTGAT